MTRRFTEIAFGPAVRQMQEEQGSRAAGARLESMSYDDSTLGPRETEFIERIDHFYMASIAESGWPYVQFRGGPKGFLRVLDDRTIAFGDFRGNRQYISTGNVREDDRVALILLDQARRMRLKIFARATTREVDSELRARLADPDYEATIERAFVLEVEAFDWNCPQHITPRYSLEELGALGLQTDL
ncbi:MAG: pyridoxamine 5'-phosphate oxidase family protein [Thermoanaerobaculia bacterium]